MRQIGFQKKCKRDEPSDLPKATQRGQPLDLGIVGVTVNPEEEEDEVPPKNPAETYPEDGPPCLWSIMKVTIQPDDHVSFQTGRKSKDDRKYRPPTVTSTPT